MNPLDEDELQALLAHAKRNSLEPPADMTHSAVERYEAKIHSRYRKVVFGLRPITIPLPVAAAASLLLVFAGALGSRVIGHASGESTRAITERSLETQRADYRNCQPVSGGTLEPMATLSFKEFQPVRQIRPRVVRSIGNEH